MSQLNDLKETFIEEYSSAKILKGMKKTKSSAILLSKSIFALCDYIIYMRYGKLPKNHSERFRILERKEKRTYGTVDAIWQKYTSTYSRPSGEDSFTLLNKAVVEIIENEITDKEIKRLIEE